MVPRSSLGFFAIAIWLGVVIAGFAAWERYDTTPGTSGDVPTSQPPSGFKWEVVMFVHPHCPCTRASLAELDGVAREIGPEVSVRIAFVIPADTPEDWERGRTWDRARELGFARVSRDVGGSEALRTGATTSGLVVVFNAAGEVVFRGGITRARGRDGDSPGRRAIGAILAGRQPELGETPVFGCPLFGLSKCAKSDESEMPCRR
ncbi:MAG: hypothetical protein K8U57_05330 [Planctomycetes bacterium]|nr:hypothetical protein [Planctomycetota bacterium]